jgi:hypothetical protein
MNRACCTVVSRNYLAYARTLHASFSRFNPDVPLFVLLADEMGDGEEYRKELFNVLTPNMLGIGGYKKLAFRYNVFELNTNLKGLWSYSYTGRLRDGSLHGGVDAGSTLLQSVPSMTSQP